MAGSVGLLTWPGSYAVDAVVASGLVKVGLVDVEGDVAPRCYPLASLHEGDVALVVSGWLHRFLKSRKVKAAEALRPLRNRFTRLIGLDQSDAFLLGLDEEEVSCLDAVLKVNGIFKDPDLYNWVVGAPRGDGCWVEKRDRRATVYSAASLQKIRPSIPCFLGVEPTLRRRTRRLYGQQLLRRVLGTAGDWFVERVVAALPHHRVPPFTVHFAGALNHVQRLAALRRVRGSSLRWKGGLTSIPKSIAGFRDLGITSLSEVERADLLRQVASEDLLVAPRNRLRYSLEMMQCKAVLSITGYGEMCFRMAEAWATGRVLVSQDLSHVETLYPLEAGRNVIYCRPDLADLVEILDDIECNYHRYADVARSGHQAWHQWAAHADDVIRQGFQPLFSGVPATPVRRDE